MSTTLAIQYLLIILKVVAACLSVFTRLDSLL
jgi:hypothetical protein